MLDLLEAAGPDAFRAAVPDRVPRGGHELPVRGIPAEGLHQERATFRRGSQGQGHASRLQRRILGRGRIDAELAEDPRDLVEGESPARGAEEEVNQGGRTEPDQEPAGDPDRERGPERDPETAPIAISHRPICFSGRARSGEAVTITAVATAMRAAR